MKKFIAFGILAFVVYSVISRAQTEDRLQSQGRSTGISSKFIVGALGLTGSALFILLQDALKEDKKPAKKFTRRPIQITKKNEDENSDSN